MAARTRFLLVYDIREARRLRRVHRVASEFGDALQYSVFVCDLTDVERAELRVALHAVIKQAVDSIALFDLGPAMGRGLRCVEHLGAAADVGPPPTRVW